MGSPIQPRVKADHGDAKLNAVHDFVEMLVEALHDARADASR